MKKNISSVLFLSLNLNLNLILILNLNLILKRPIRQAGLNFLLFLILLVPLGNLTSCSTLEPKLEPELKLDVSCTEAWLQLTTSNIQLPATINLLKNNSVSQVYVLNTQDSLLYIDSLLPNQSYKFKVVVNTTNNPLPTTNEVLAQTMDTTSHNFTWQTFTFGQHSSSALYDVAIINENDIWAVGEIYMLDSLGNPDPSCYNAVHWDGIKWELKRILYKGGIWVIRTIFAFSPNDVWFSGYVRYLNGQFIELTIPDILIGWSINKLWGSSSEDLYAVGNNGNIAHYNNGSWTKIESGTDVSLNDIYGTPDGKQIWSCGWNYQTGRSTILKIRQNDTQIIWDSEIPDPNIVYSGLINSICSNGNNEFIFVGGQVYRQSLLNGRLAKREWVKTENGFKILELGNYAYRIKSSDKNNISVVGDAAMVWHYNGSTWYKFTELRNEEDRLYGLATKDNITVTVGKRYALGTLGGGLIIIGRR